MISEPAEEGATGIALAALRPTAETARNAAANKVFMMMSFLVAVFRAVAEWPRSMIRRREQAVENIRSIIDAR